MKSLVLLSLEACVTHYMMPPVLPWPIRFDYTIEYFRRVSGNLNFVKKLLPNCLITFISNRQKYFDKYGIFQIKFYYFRFGKLGNPIIFTWNIVN